MGAAFVVSFSLVDAYIWAPLAVHRHGAPALSLSFSLLLSLLTFNLSIASQTVCPTASPIERVYSAEATPQERYLVASHAAQPPSAAMHQVQALG